jgi:hypothetical protein
MTSPRNLPADSLGRALTQPIRILELVFTFLSVCDGLSLCVSRGHKFECLYWRGRHQFNKRCKSQYHGRLRRDRQAQQQAQRAQAQAQQQAQRAQAQARLRVLGDTAANPICL